MIKLFASIWAHLKQGDYAPVILNRGRAFTPGDAEHGWVAISDESAATALGAKRAPCPHSGTVANSAIFGRGQYRFYIAGGGGSTSYTDRGVRCAACGYQASGYRAGNGVHPHETMLIAKRKFGVIERSKLES